MTPWVQSSSVRRFACGPKNWVEGNETHVLKIITEGSPLLHAYIQLLIYDRGPNIPFRHLFSLTSPYKEYLVVSSILDRTVAAGRRNRLRGRAERLDSQNRDIEVVVVGRESF